jgi:HEAT repeat protein
LTSTGTTGAGPAHAPGANKRVFAFLVDGVTYSVAIALGAMALPQLAGAGGWLLWSAYFLIRDLPGASLGKRVTNLTILDHDGQPAATGGLLLRNVPIAIPFVAIAEYFVMKASPDGRRWGDRWANTRVQDLNPGLSDGRYLWYSISLVVVLVLLQAFAGRSPVQAAGPAQGSKPAPAAASARPLRDLIESLGTPRWLEARGAILEMKEAAVPELAAAALSHANARVRERAVGTFGQLVSPQTVPTLIKALQDREMAVREEAANSLLFRALYKDPGVAAAVPALADTLKDPEALVRMEAAEALGAIGPPAKNALPALVAALQANQKMADLGEAMAAVEMARALAKIDQVTAQQRALPFLISAYDSRPDARERIVEGLQDFEAPEKVMPTFIRALGDADANVRRHAAAGLGKIGPRAAPAIPPLTTALKDTDELVRQAAATALQRIRGK